MKHEDETAALTASLAAWLAPVRLSGMTAQQATSLLTERTRRWAVRQGWKVELEADARLRRASSGNPGRLDVLCRRARWMPAVAIEIDRANKRWSLDKLAAEAAAGNVAIWVRWRGVRQIEVPSSVGLVDLRVSAAFDIPLLRQASSDH